MIFLCISGGLGNQMFQYAAAKALSKRIGKDVRVVDHAVVKDIKRNFELPGFGIKDRLESEIFGSVCWSYSSCAKKICSLVGKSGWRGRCFIEREYEFDEGFFSAPAGGGLLINGIFQSYKYFSEIENEIRCLYSPKQTSKDYVDLLKKIGSVNSVSIHVRRGDYVECSRTSEYHGVCDIGYYDKSIDLLKKEVSDPRIFLFSDDIEWCRRTFSKVDIPVTFIDDAYRLSEHQEISLMSHCDHNIIANSSFSWWGAWLNRNLEKKVVAPRQWFLKGPSNTDDLIPEEWIRI